jgi:protein-S-isoprenylcysteine O-methyltransferase
MPSFYKTHIQENRQLGPKGLFSYALGLSFITLVFCVGAWASVYTESVWQFGVYLVCLSMFHFLEYVLTALFHPETLSFDSTLLNHSEAYQLAVAVCVCEYWVELFLFPWSKNNGWITLIGVCAYCVGQFARTSAMWTAGRNFTHLLATKKQPGHQLVTHGVYAYVRHPSYFGHFVLSLGIVTILQCPIAFVGYVYVLNNFFTARVEMEEEFLTSFFKSEYVQYKKDVPTERCAIM